jgi:signal transduction histidine kinase
MQDTRTARLFKRIDIARIPHAPVLLGAAFAFLIVIVLSSLFLLGSANRERDELVRTIDLQGQLSDLLAALRRMESGQRGYLLTGDKAFLDVYNDTRPTLDRLLSDLDARVEEDASLSEQVDRLKPMLENKRQEMEESIALYNSGRGDEAIALVRTGMGKLHMENIRKLIRQVQTETATQRTEQYQSALEQEHWLLGINGVAVALILLLAGSSVYLVQRANAAMRRAQQVLKDANLELEASVASRTAELTAANEEIQKFAYIVSHDLRSPLVNIMGFTSELEALKQDLFAKLSPPAGPGNGGEAPNNANGAAANDQLEEDFDEALRFIKASITKMDRLINAVLTISREGNRNLQPESIDMNELFGTIKSATAHQAQEAEAEVSIGALPIIVSDRLALEQIFSNLVDNALKYLRRDVKGEVKIRASNQGSKILIEVKDNGRGIEPRDQVRVFELFRRAGAQDKPGEGMGLAHVRALVRRIGGSITVESKLGEGSAFRVALPRTLPKDKRMSA